jgi:BirA family biotin operon repressor/biotin-[acetyl-CoA-carboxylase] ligase
VDNIEGSWYGNELAAELAAELGGAAAVHYLPQVDSTNSCLKSRAAEHGHDQISIVFTDRQTAGRGTRGRDWLQAPAGDIALSLGFGVGSAQRIDSRLSLVVGALIAGVIERDTALPLRVKWPNDVLTRPLRQPAGPWRKVCGVLIETCAAAGAQLLIVGAGVNVNSTVSQYPAELRDRLTTLRDAVGHSLNRQTLLLLLVRGLASLTGLVGVSAAGPAFVPARTFDEMVREWLERDVTAGTHYILCREGMRHPVTALRVDAETCGLWCRDQQGREHLVTSYTELEQPPSG